MPDHQNVAQRPSMPSSTSAALPQPLSSHSTSGKPGSTLSERLRCPATNPYLSVLEASYEQSQVEASRQFFWAWSFALLEFALLLGSFAIGIATTVFLSSLKRPLGLGVTTTALSTALGFMSACSS